eukprot:gene5709-biopygen22260
MITTGAAVGAPAAAAAPPVGALRPGWPCQRGIGRDPGITGRWPASVLWRAGRVLARPSDPDRFKDVLNHARHTVNTMASCQCRRGSTRPMALWILHGAAAPLPPGTGGASGAASSGGATSSGRGGGGCPPHRTRRCAPAGGGGRVVACEGCGGMRSGTRCGVRNAMCCFSQGGEACREAALRLPAAGAAAAPCAGAADAAGAQVGRVFDASDRTHPETVHFGRVPDASDRTRQKRVKNASQRRPRDPRWGREGYKGRRGRKSREGHGLRSWQLWQLLRTGRLSNMVSDVDLRGLMNMPPGIDLRGLSNMPPDVDLRGLSNMPSDVDLCLSSMPPYGGGCGGGGASAMPLDMGGGPKTNMAQRAAWEGLQTFQPAPSMR